MQEYVRHTVLPREHPSNLALLETEDCGSLENRSTWLQPRLFALARLLAEFSNDEAEQVMLKVDN